MSSDGDNDPLELPTQALRDAAFELFGETKELRTQMLAELRSRLADVDFGVFDTSDACLMRYLRGKKFDLDKAVKCITNTIEFNKKHPTWTQNWDPSEFQIFSNFISILSQRDKENRVILLLRPAKFLRLCSVDFIKSHPNVLIRFNLWLNNSLTLHPEINVYGAVLLLSARELTLWDAATVNSIAKVDERAANFRYLFSCAPMRIGGVYFFDEPFYIRWVWNAVSLVLSTKMTSRVHVNSNNYAKLKDIVEDTTALPTCIGGNNEAECSDAVANEWMRNLFFPPKENAASPSDSNNSSSSEAAEQSTEEE